MAGAVRDARIRIREDTVSEPTRQQLDRLIDLAEQLGFWDDVAHWEAEKERLYGTEQS